MLRIKKRLIDHYDLSNKKGRRRGDKSTEITRLCLGPAKPRGEGTTEWNTWETKNEEFQAVLKKVQNALLSKASDNAQTAAQEFPYVVP